MAETDEPSPRRRGSVVSMVVIIALLLYIGYTVNQTNRRADRAAATAVEALRFDEALQVAAQCRNTIRDRFLSDIAGLAATTSRPLDPALFQALADDHAALASAALNQTCPYPSPPEIEGQR